MDGVHVFFLCSFANSVAFQIVAFSLICFPNLRFFICSIKIGIVTSHTIKVIIQKENIDIKFEFIFLFLTYLFLIN